MPNYNVLNQTLRNGGWKPLRALLVGQVVLGNAFWGMQLADKFWVKSDVGAWRFHIFHLKSPGPFSSEVRSMEKSFGKSGVFMHGKNT